MKKLLKKSFIGLSLFTMSLCGCSNGGEQHVVTFNSNGGSPVEKQYVKHGEKVIKPKDPTRKGFTFKNWTYQDREWEFVGFVVTENMQLDANWDGIYYTVTLDANGGNIEDSEKNTYEVQFDMMFNLPTASNLGWTFDGWFYNNDGEYVQMTDGSGRSLKPYSINGNVTLIAQWSVEYKEKVDSKYFYGRDTQPTLTLYTPRFFAANSIINYATFEKPYSSLYYYSDFLFHLNNVNSSICTYDKFGNIQNELAKTITKNETGTEYTIEIKENIPWITSNLTQYEYKDVKQFVTADDFVTTIKILLVYDESKFDFVKDDYFKAILNIENALEFYCYSKISLYIQEKKVVDGFDYSTLKGDFKGQAAKIMEMIKDYSGQEADAIDGSDIRDIQDFKRVGIRQDDNGRLVIRLKDADMNFEEKMTSLVFSPTNYNFYSHLYKDTYGFEKEKMLYCGPYIVSKLVSSSLDGYLTYLKNPFYVNAENVNIPFVRLFYTLSFSDYVDAFESGLIDGGVTFPEGENLWKKYVNGPDNSGTVEKPYDSRVCITEINGELVGSISKLITYESPKNYNSSFIIRNFVGAYALKEYPTASEIRSFDKIFEADKALSSN